MPDKRLKYIIPLCIFAMLFLFTAFVLKPFNLWFSMLIGMSILSGVGLYLNHKEGEAINFRLFYFKPKYVLLGIVFAVLLYLVFYLGDKLSALIFTTANNNIGLMFNTKNDFPIPVIVLLIILIGSAEEIFWRGYVQDTLQLKFGDNKGWLIASVIYALTHLAVMNILLFFAALIGGLVWGYLLKRYKSLWVSIFCHTVWDLGIFIILPIK